VTLAWLDIWPLLYCKFTAECVLKRNKIAQHFGKVMEKSWLPQAPCAPGHCPADRWRTRLRSDIWREATVVRAWRYNKYLSLTLTPWLTSVKLVICQPLRNSLLLDWCSQWLQFCAQAFCCDVFLGWQICLMYRSAGFKVYGHCKNIVFASEQKWCYHHWMNTFGQLYWTSESCMKFASLGSGSWQFLRINISQRRFRALMRYIGAIRL